MRAGRRSTGSEQQGPCTAWFAHLSGAVMAFWLHTGPRSPDAEGEKKVPAWLWGSLGLPAGCTFQELQPRKARGQSRGWAGRVSVPLRLEGVKGQGGSARAAAAGLCSPRLMGPNCSEASPRGPWETMRSSSPPPSCTDEETEAAETKLPLSSLFREMTQGNSAVLQTGARQPGLPWLPPHPWSCWHPSPARLPLHVAPAWPRLASL